MIGHTFKVLGISSAALMAISIAVLAQPAPAPAPAAPVPGAVSPAPAPVANRPMVACRNDIKTLCSGVERGKGAKMQCLVANKTKASAECQAAMVALQERMVTRGLKQGGKPGRFAACRTDIATLCPEAKGKERAQCLRQNQAKVSPACGEALAAMPARMREQAAPVAPTPAAPGALEAPKPQ